MSVENGIRHLLNKKAESMVESIVEATEVSEAYPGMGNNKEASPMAQGSSSTTKPEVLELGSGAGAKVTASQPLAAGVGPKEDMPMKQGSSEDATIDSKDDQDTQGKTQSAKMKKDTTLPKGKGVGKATNFTDYMDLVSAVSRVGNIMAKEEVEVEVEAEEEVEEEVEEEEDFITEEEYNALSDEEKAEYEALDLTEEEYDALSDEEQAEYDAIVLEELELEEAAKWRSNPKAYDVHHDDFGARADDMGHPHSDNTYKKSKADTPNKYGSLQTRPKPQIATKGPGAGKITKTSAERLKSRIKARNEAMEQVEKDGKSKMSAKKDMLMKKIKESLATDVQTLFSTELDLSEDFKANAASLFEAVVTARVAFEMQEIEEALTEEAADALVELHEELINNVDGYLTHVAEQWLADNEVAIETGLRAEITEDFISGLKTLFEESYIEIPEEKYNVLGEMQAQNEALIEKVNEVMEEANELKKELEESKREAVFVKVTADLAQTEAEKLHGLVEDVEFENETIFEKKLNVIKTNYFPKSSPTSVVVESDAVITEEVSGTMLKYAEMIGRTSFGK